MRQSALSYVPYFGLMDLCSAGAQENKNKKTTIPERNIHFWVPPWTNLVADFSEVEPGFFLVPPPLLGNYPCDFLQGGGQGTVTLNNLVYPGTLVFQVWGRCLHLPTATAFVHCGANALIASQAMHFSVYHVDCRVFFFGQFQPWLLTMRNYKIVP